MGIRHPKKCQGFEDYRDIVKSEEIVVFVERFEKESFETIQIFKKFLLRPFIIDVDQEVSRISALQAAFQLSGNMKCPLIFISGGFFGSLKELKSSVKRNLFTKTLKTHKISFRELTEDEEKSLEFR
jgi:hypothetical protein